VLILKKNTKPLYFVHIPRTGGRYLRELFFKNNYILNHWNFNERYRNIEVPHLQYPYYNKFTHHGKIEQFTIVRNPVDRFISMFFAGIVKDNINVDKNKILNNKNFLFEYIEKNIFSNSHSNWFLPQHHFINHNCKIWKIENGLDYKFFKWIKVNFNINLKIKKVEYRVNYDFYKKNKLNKKTINYIKEFYKNDYKLLGYK